MCKLYVTIEDWTKIELNECNVGSPTLSLSLTGSVHTFVNIWIHILIAMHFD